MSTSGHDEKPLYIALIRHGAVINPYTPPGYYGCVDVDLSDVGKEEARHAGAYLAAHTLQDAGHTPEGGLPFAQNLGLVMHSGLKRALFGAEQVVSACSAAKGADIPLECDKGFYEMDRGVWAGLTKEQIIAVAPDGFAKLASDPDYRPEGGENLHDVQQRVSEAFERLVAACTERGVKCAAVVAHNWVIRVLCAKARGEPLTCIYDIEIPTASITTLRVTRNPVSLKELEVGVIPGPPREKPTGFVV